jgi:DNA-binding transcriptional MerR regulator
MDEAEAITFSLDELANESGLDTRVIRSFIEQGLLRGPSKLGRYAKYSRQHLNKLLAIKVLKDKRGLKLSEVRQQLLSMSEAQIEMLANGGASLNQPKGSALDYILSAFKRPITSVDELPPPVMNIDFFDADDFDDDDNDLTPAAKSLPAVPVTKHQPPPLPPQTILDGWGPTPEYYQRITKERMTTPIGKLLVGLEEQTGDKNVRRQAKRETWYRIQVTPDIELSVRGINDDEQLARLERVADYLREILTGEA